MPPHIAPFWQPVKRKGMMQRIGRIRRPQVMPDEKKAHKASAATLAHIDELLDEALKQTFPASDPVAINIEHASDERRDAKPLPSVS
jgi:hypothetical protein